MILQVSGVTKRFGGLDAVRRVSLELEEGRILGLIGPNGAGKTTLFNLISGIHRPDEGRIRFRGREVTGLPPHRLARMGLARTHQIVQPLNDLTVRENVTVGACFGRENRRLREAGRIAAEVLDFVRLADRAEQLAGNLNVAQKKRLELARALAGRPHLLLLDEVLAGLNPAEIDETSEMVREIRRRGVSIIMIEHVMRAVMKLSDRVMVLNYGEQIAEGPPEEVSKNPQVVEAYLGDPELARSLFRRGPGAGEDGAS